MAKRDTYKYHFKVGNEILHCGITNDLDRREKEHQMELGHIVQVGNITTREAAQKWELPQIVKRQITDTIQAINKRKSSFVMVIWDIITKNPLVSTIIGTIIAAIILKLIF